MAYDGAPTGLEEEIIIDRTVLVSMEEIMKAARKLRPDDEFSYSDVIQLLFELAKIRGYSTEDIALGLVCSV